MKLPVGVPITNWDSERPAPKTRSMPLLAIKASQLVLCMEQTAALLRSSLQSTMR
ncbi:MAG: hypothetical protein ACRD51_06270 [Candidatus Acidiferrum sp.]